MFSVHLEILNPSLLGFGTIASSKLVIFNLLKVTFLAQVSKASVLSGKIGASSEKPLYYSKD
jgi:hypothetical protein